jgi:hypothetical protein
VYGNQEATRRAEGNWTDSKAIHNIDEAEANWKSPRGGVNRRNQKFTT